MKELYKRNLCLNCGHVFYNRNGKGRGKKTVRYRDCNVRDFKSKNCSKACSANWWHKNPIFKKIVSEAMRKYNESKK